MDNAAADASDTLDKTMDMDGFSLLLPYPLTTLHGSNFTIGNIEVRNYIHDQLIVKEINKLVKHSYTP
jgi:hypothetical protein